MDIKNKKKEHKKEWLLSFPELTVYGANKLLKIMGPTLVGIELFHHPRLDKRYRPYFVCYTLFEKDEKTCIKNPVIDQMFHTPNNLQLDISYCEDKDNLKEIISHIRKQIKIPLEGNVSLDNVLEMIQYQISYNDSIRDNIVAQAQFYLFQFVTGIYMNDSTLINNAIENIEIKKKKWPYMFVWEKFGDENSWFVNLKKMVCCNNYEEILNKIEMNKHDKKFKRLIVSDIIR